LSPWTPPRFCCAPRLAFICYLSLLFYSRVSGPIPAFGGAKKLLRNNLTPFRFDVGVFLFLFRTAQLRLMLRFPLPLSLVPSLRHGERSLRFRWLRTPPGKDSRFLSRALRVEKDLRGCFPVIALPDFRRMRRVVLFCLPDPDRR